MQLSMIPFQRFNCFNVIDAAIKERGMTHYASEFGFGSTLNDKISRTMKLFLISGREVDRNFKRIFKYSPQGIELDWKLSEKAYKAILFSEVASEAIVYGFLIDEISEDMIYKAYVSNKISITNFCVKPDMCQA